MNIYDRPSLLTVLLTVSECFMAFSEVLQTIKNVNRTVNGCNAFEPELNDENFHLYVHGLLEFNIGNLFQKIHMPQVMCTET